jgi:hypothetical protein
MAARAYTSEADVARLAQALRAGDRAQLARAITLIESRRTDHQQRAHQLVQMLLPSTGQAVRVGITRCRQVDHHRRARELPDATGAQGRRAGGRSVLDPQRRFYPGRQDPHAAARG